MRPDEAAPQNPVARGVNWKVAKQIFTAALDLPTAERESFVNAQLPDDPETACQVASLLRAHRKTDAFLVEPKCPDIDHAASLPERIGPYRPIERLGEGGFGVVYRAHQSEPIERDVAIKLLRPGFDTPEMLARFRDERQYLAKLDHGDIVKVLDAGVSEDHRAYLVMEYVPGEPITAAASRCSPRDRLRLIVRVCRVVHAMHQRGVIHRDLKPTNILVQDGDDRTEPRVRIIDFGIAAAVQRADREAVTAVGMPLGTPRYASPEQTAGEAGIDTRTDVYALGMLLCEVLTGKLPRQAGASEGSAVTRPSELLPTDRSTLRGDLDRIVLKAVAWDPEERYDSSAALADDIERFMRGEPVLATRPSTIYTVRKFVTRRRGVSAILAASALAIVGGGSSLLVGIDRARTAQLGTLAALAEATAERDRADSINNFLLVDVIESMNPNLTGTPIPRSDDLLAMMSEMGASAFADAPGTAYELLDRVGDAQRSLGLFDETAFSRATALEAATRAFGPYDAITLDSRIEALLSRQNARDFDGTADEMRQIVRLTQEHLGVDHPIALRARIHAFHLAPDLAAGEDPAEMPMIIERAGLGGSAVHIEALEILGDMLSQAGDRRGTEMLVRGVDLATELYGPTGNITLEIANRIGKSLLESGRYDDAAAVLRGAYDDSCRVYGAGRHIPQTLLNQMVIAAYSAGRTEEGLDLAKSMHEIAIARESADENFASLSAMTIAQGYEELGKYDEAVPWRRQRLERILSASDDAVTHQTARSLYIMTLVGAGRIDQAAAEYGMLRGAKAPRDGFRLSATISLARGLKKIGRIGEASTILREERESEAYTADSLALLDRWIAHLGSNLEQPAQQPQHGIE